jgi:hypothetical protein
MVRVPGALSKPQLLLIIQNPTPPHPPAGVTGRHAKNYADLINYARREPLYLVPHSELLYAPVGGTHYFLYEYAAFTLQHVRDFFDRTLQRPPIAPAPR